MRPTRVIATIVTATLLSSLAYAGSATAEEAAAAPNGSCPQGTTPVLLTVTDEADRNGDGTVCATPGGENVDNNAQAPIRRRR